jgi:hypothetical protein
MGRIPEAEPMSNDPPAIAEQAAEVAGSHPQDNRTPDNPSGLTWGYPIRKETQTSNPPNDPTPVEVVYKNWRGETRLRTIVPRSIRYGIAPPWHPEPGYILTALDGEDGREKDFALCGFQCSNGFSVFDSAGTADRRSQAWQREQERLGKAT